MKTEPTERVLSIKVGEFDSSGYKVINVLAINNEYVIYEADHEDINFKLRVLIDGHTDESEAEIQKRFNKVKPDYIKAKGMLKKNPLNRSNLTQRIAHTLSSCLYSDEDNNEKAFENLIKEIQKEHSCIVFNRLFYILPSICLLVMGIIFLIFYKAEADHYKYIKYIFAGLMGGTLSLWLAFKNINFEEYLLRRNYFWIGFERIFLSILTTGIAYLLIMANLIFPDISDNEYKMLAIFIVAGFSETLLPSLLTNIKSN